VLSPSPLSTWRAKPQPQRPQAETTGVAARPKRTAESGPNPRSPAVRYSSITQSAIASNVGRTSSASTFAVLRLLLKFSWLNLRKIAGLLAIEDATRVGAGLAEDIEDAQSSG
jgi:hypothetical protein